MTITIHQRAGLQVNDETAISLEWLAELKPYYSRVELLLNARAAHLPERVPAKRVKEIRALGYVVWGVVWADSFADPIECVRFCESERQRIRAPLDSGVTFSGFVINAEDGVEARDLAGEKWSRTFTAAYRASSALGKLSLCLNTYIGCGGIDLRAWQDRGARLLVQTHHEGQTFEWPMVGYKDWAKQYGWTALARMKPQWGVYKGADGSRASIAAQVADAKACGTVGFSAYYAEGAMPPDLHLIPLFKAAKAAGVAY